MSSLENIGIRVEQTELYDGFTHNVQPLLSEIKHALDELIEKGQTSIIDLAALPFTEADETQLRNLLGRGEITAEVNSLGISSIQETAVHGVWLIDHRAADDRRLAFHIEITNIPEILKTPAEDMLESRLQLEDIINQINAETQEASQ